MLANDTSYDGGGNEGKNSGTVEDVECCATVEVTPSPAISYCYEGPPNDAEMDNEDSNARVAGETGAEDVTDEVNDEIALPPQVNMCRL